ncbi:MAG: M28 family peptidase, partial [Candidatus Latescibacteria bacterium]|nr:M28 family peptidase [Candidatus Latescibacterota bacterium]
MASRLLLFTTLCLLTWPVASPAQEQPNPIPLLPESLLNRLIQEVSGALAMNHTIELGGYDHDRLKEEYDGEYHESQYIVRMAKQYRFSDVHIEKFPLDAYTWDAEAGELWLVSPARRVIVSYRDVPACVATGSWNADVTADLVYARAGTDSSDYRGLDVMGKLVLVSGSIADAHKLAVRTFGAAGVLSFKNPVGRPLDQTDQIAWQGLGGGPASVDTTHYPYRETFGFNLSHRMGMELLALLEARRPVRLRALVKTTTYPADMEMVTAAIPGDGSTDQEIVLVGHLFEGIAKQGANDDMSGCAAILEAGRTLITLIDDGSIPRPRRTIRFLWVPEISGTFAVLDRYPEERKRMIAAIAVDMIGSRMTASRNSLHLYRNPSSMASFVDDITQTFFEYVGDTNREKVHNRGIAYSYMNPILDPTGSRDPFYYNIEKYYGSSDHAVFNGLTFRIPAVLFNNWPDIAYHTSEDRPALLDATQLKRGAFLIAASALCMAGVYPSDVPRLATRFAGMASQRIDDEMTQQVELMSTTSPDSLAWRYRDARAFIHEAYQRELRSLNSLAVYVEYEKEVGVQVKTITAELMKRESYDQDRLANHFQRLARRYRLSTKEPAPTPVDVEASQLIPTLVPVALDTSLSVVQRMRKAMGLNAPPAKLRGFKAAECKMFCDGMRTILDIRNAVSAEFGAVPE